MAKMNKKSDIEDIVDGTLTPSDEEIREQEILKQKQKRKQRMIEEKEKAKQEKIDKKKAERKKNIEKKKKERYHKQVEKEKTEIKRELEKQQKREEKQRNEEEKRKIEEKKQATKQRIARQKEKERKRKELEKRQKQEEQRKIEERKRRIEQRKQQKQDDEFEYEANTAIKMTMKNNKRREEKERLSKEQKELKKRKKRLKKVASFAVLLIIVISGSVFALVSPIFNIKTIEIKGNDKISSETIESLSGLHENENIFRFLKVNVRQAIKKEPYIEDVKVKRILPSTVQITIEERAKKFCIEFLNNYAIINSQGYILEISKETQRNSYNSRVCNTGGTN